MASVWVRLGRWLDAVFGGAGQNNEIDQAQVDEAITLIQTAIDQEQRERSVKKLKISDLSPERQSALAQELQRLLKKNSTEEQV